MDDRLIATLRIREVVENWVIFRDSGNWPGFATVWHDDGWMTATWFQGPAAEFIEASRAGLESGVNILHFLGGTSVEVSGSRAVAQTKMTIQQRASVHGVEVDVTCTGRFYDFFEEREEREGRGGEGRWAIVRRQPIYEKDRMDVLDPAASVRLDRAALEGFPVGYRHLAYLQQAAGHVVMHGLPGLRGPEVELLYTEGAQWLAGADQPGVPLAG
jgi:hypothetical protein